MSEPESIERDGVSYVPRLWLQGHRDALDTALARVEALEAHVADADTALTKLMQARDRWIAKVLAAEARTEALEATARAVVDWATVANAIAGYPACRCCGRVIDGWDTHRHADCAMGRLAALLGDEE